MNTSDYTFSESTPTHVMSGYFESETAEGFLEFQTKQIKGLTPFGAHSGVITEDKLTPSIVEFLLSKEDGNGNKIYEEFLIKKSKNEKSKK